MAKEDDHLSEIKMVNVQEVCSTSGGFLWLIIIPIYVGRISSPLYPKQPWALFSLLRCRFVCWKLEKIIWTKPSFLGSILIFQGVTGFWAHLRAGLPSHSSGSRKPWLAPTIQSCSSTPRVEWMDKWSPRWSIFTLPKTHTSPGKIGRNRPKRKPDRLPTIHFRGRTRC